MKTILKSSVVCGKYYTLSKNEDEYFLTLRYVIDNESEDETKRVEKEKAGGIKKLDKKAIFYALDEMWEDIDD